MDMNHHLRTRQEQGCISCEGASPVCNCAANEQCILTGRSCNQCPSIECIPSANSGGKSINPGVIAGPVVAALVILGVVALWYLRRKRRRDLARVEELAQRAHKAEAAGFHLQSHPGSPGPGSARSARSNRSERSSQLHQHQQQQQQRRRTQSPRSPDPNAPVNAEWYDENGQLRALGGVGGGGGHDPFSDRQSVSTTGTDARSSHVIPIKYLPRHPSDEGLSKHLGTGGNGHANGNGGRPSAPADAARALDEARANLFKNGKTPARPARSPDLDLRLNPSVQQQLNPPSSFLDTLRTPGNGAGAGLGGSRDSYLSGNSGAPSYLSGSTDYIHLDAPKIVTSRQIQVGRLQQAEMVQLGRPLNQSHNMENLNGSNANAYANTNPIQSSPSTPTSQTNPFGGGSSDDNHHHQQQHREQQRGAAPLSPATFGSRTLGYDISDAASGSASYRTLTPVPSYRTTNAEEDLHTEPSSHDHDHDHDDNGGDTPTTGDLRFSMGTFSRDSVSTVGTGRYLAQAVPLPRPNANIHDPRNTRESMSSDRSGVSSVLHGFPMIPPNQPVSHVGGGGGQRSPIPQSTSVTTLEHAAMPSRPPTTHRTPATASASGSGSGCGGGNRETQASVGLGGFPFVPPPNQEQQPSAGLPTAITTSGTGTGTDGGPPTLPHPTKGRNTIGMSTTSEGLGGFDFSFDGQPPMPDPRP